MLFSTSYKIEAKNSILTSIETKNMEAIDLIVQNWLKCNSFIYEAVYALSNISFDPKILSTLFSQEALINEKNEGGKTALHALECIYDTEKAFAIGKTLIENGADINAKDRDGQKPLDNLSEELRARLLALPNASESIPA